MSSQVTPAGGSLRSSALAGLALFAGPGRDGSPELDFLRGHGAPQASRPEEWLAAFRAIREAPSEEDRSLLALAEEFELSALELLSVALAAAVEDDPLVGRAVARLQAPVGGSRPTVGLLVAAFSASLNGGPRALEVLAAGPAVSAGLLRVAPEGGPLPERAVSVPLHVCLALNGYDGAVTGTRLAGPEADRIPLPPSILTEAARHGAALDGGERRVLVLRSGSPVEGRAVAAAVAEAIGRRAVFVEGERVEGLTPWLLLRGLLPVFCLDLAPGERRALPPIPLYAGPALALCGPDGSVDAGDSLAGQWTVPVPTATERRKLWTAALGSGRLASELARHHRHSSGRIAHLGRLVRHQTALDGRSRPNRDDVSAASWNLEGGGLDALAQALPDRVPDAAFVAPAALREEMDSLVLRCRGRDELTSGLGPSAVARYRPGVRALFVGPSGTGKTLAAAWLATRLGLPLYRVDLASVTSKYIGETEKNLAEILARAEQAEVVLLFDEADSLFGKRTDVSDANDRFANAQTNYLLQRIEVFEGIAILTSNSRARFDSAFARRLDVVVEFPLPGPEERRALWESHLGSGHRLERRELNQLAAQADVPGGHIRNAVLSAAVLARHARRPIAYDDVLAGLLGEYRKLGRQLPATLRNGG